MVKIMMIILMIKTVMAMMFLQECSTAEEYKELLTLMEERLRVMRQVTPTILSWQQCNGDDDNDRGGVKIAHVAIGSLISDLIAR